jgi:hypothetical protein
VDAEALPAELVAGIKAGKVDRIQSMGIQCAFCHSNVDDSFAPGIGKRLDGWANRDLNVGAIVSLRRGARRPLRHADRVSEVALARPDAEGSSRLCGHRRRCAPLIDGALGVRTLGRKIDDEEQLVAEPGGPGRAHESLFLPCRVSPQKADRLAFPRLDQDPDVDARDDAKLGAELLHRALQTRRVGARG